MKSKELKPCPFCGKNEKPIIFSTAMVKVILENRKTMTRRVIKPQVELCPICDNSGSYGEHCCGGDESRCNAWCPEEVQCEFCWTKENSLFNITRKSPYQKDQILWVRETYSPDLYDSGESVYKADADECILNNKYIKWKPSIFMPRKATRIFLKITNVRVERLQDITRSDIRKEGLVCPEHLASDDKEYNYRHWYIDDWIKLWDSINKKRGYGWDTNPWVWVIVFEKEIKIMQKIEGEFKK